VTKQRIVTLHTSSLSLSSYSGVSITHTPDARIQVIHHAVIGETEQTALDCITPADANASQSTASGGKEQYRRTEGCGTSRSTIKTSPTAVFINSFTAAFAPTGCHLHLQPAACLINTENQRENEEKSETIRERAERPFLINDNLFRLESDRHSNVPQMKCHLSLTHTHTHLTI